MRNTKRSSLRLALAALAAAFGLLACRAPAAPERSVPQSWFASATEDQEQPPGLGSPGLARASATFDEILGVHRQVLEGLDPSATSVAGTGADCPKPWHLGGYVTSLGVTVGGILGALTGNNGTAVCQVQWLPVDRKARAAPAEPAAASIRLSEDTDPRELQAKLEPAIQGALSTHLIRDEARFRANLQTTAEGFQAVARGLAGLQIRGGHWAPDLFRLEAVFDLNGGIVSLVDVGATMVVRFDWERKKAAPAGAPEDDSRPIVLAQGAGDELAQRVRAFVGAVSEDLDVLDTASDQMERNELKLSGIRIGAGFTIQGDVWFASASGFLTGSFEFHRQPEGGGPPLGAKALTDLGRTADFPEFGDSLDMLVDAPEALALSDAVGAPASPLALGETPKSKVVVRIKRKVFRRGLLRAAAISRFFTDRASRLRVGRWGVHAVSTEFDMSLAGTIGIATVGGTGLVELVYANPSL